MARLADPPDTLTHPCSPRPPLDTPTSVRQSSLGIPGEPSRRFILTGVRHLLEADPQPDMGSEAEPIRNGHVRQDSEEAPRKVQESVTVFLERHLGVKKDTPEELFS